MVTIRDVAKQAGVSASTASRALRNSPLISMATREKVKRIAEKMNYTPNFTAHNLATNVNNMVGIVFPVDNGDLHKNPFYIELIEGINQVVNPQQIFVTVAIGNTVEELLQNIKMMIDNSRINQFILLYSSEDDPILSYLQERKVDYTLIGKPYRDANRIPYVDNDNVSAGLDATDMLIRQGHRSIGYAYTSSSRLVQTDRLIGFHEALRRHALYGYDLLLEDEVDDKVIRGFLQNHPKISAILASDDILAFLVQKEVQRVAPDRQIKLMGFNDSLFAELAEPKISTVQIYPKRLGRAAAQLMLQMRAHNPSEPAAKIIVPYKLVIR